MSRSKFRPKPRHWCGCCIYRPTGIFAHMKPSAARRVLGHENDIRHGLIEEELELDDTYDDNWYPDCEKAIDRRDCSCWFEPTDVSDWEPSFGSLLAPFYAAFCLRARGRDESRRHAPGSTVIAVGMLSKSGSRKVA